MTDHPKIQALETLINERRLIKAKELIKDIDVDLMRLKEIDETKTEEKVKEKWI